MFYNSLRTLGVLGLFLFLVILSTLAGTAQTNVATAPPAAGTLPPVANASGLSFRYLRTLGTVATPYLADTTHLNRPHGLSIDANNNLVVVEEQGRRVLKYNASGSNLLAIGKAGVCYTANTVFCIPYDAVTDPAGNLWVADGNRIVQYSAAGVFLQQLPTENSWEAGNDNTHFDNVRGITISPNGQLFVADGYNQRIQVYTLAGNTLTYSTTIGVTGESGADNTHFNQPYRLVVDQLNRLYVVDKENNRVQRCTLAGSWLCTPFVTGLNQPQGIALGPDGHIFIADTNNGRILKCAAVGSCSDFSTEFEWPSDVAVDSNGNVYSAAAYESYVYKLNSSGQFMGAFVGVKFDPYLTDTQHFNHPRVTVDKDGNLLIVEENGQRLLKLDSVGKLLWVIGEPGVDNGENDHFQWPHGATTDSTGKVYVADGSRVQIFSGDGVYLATLGAGWGAGVQQFDWASGVAVDANGTIYVSDSNNHRVQIFDRNRQYVGTLGVTRESGADNAHFNLPIDVEVDAAGNLYVADHLNCRVQKFNANRVYQMTFGKPGSCTPDLTDVAPEEVAVDALGRVYVAGWHDRVQVFDRNGAYLTTIGGAWGERPGEMRGTNSVALDKAGNVYVGDFENARIQIFAPGTPGWQQTNLNGFGERTNESATALEVFNGRLFAGVTNYSYGGTVWHTSDGANWQRVSEPGFTNALSVTNAVIFDLIEFKGNLYAGTGVWWNDGIAGQVWRTGDGQSWTQVVDNGFGHPQNNGVVAFGQFQDLLYAATINNETGLEIWRTATGNPLDWTRVVNAGFGGGVEYNISYPFQEFNGQLYVGVESNNEQGSNGLRIFRSSDGLTWTQVNQDGFGNRNNNHPGAFAVFQGLLYIGVRNDTAGGQIWRSSDGQQWSQVIGNGFGDLNNYKLESLAVFDNALYVVASNGETGIEVWYSQDGAQWRQVNVDGFGSLTNHWTLWGNATTVFKDAFYIGVTNYATGATLWRSNPERGVYLPLVKR
jgi:sugar lactone lactonase YvrE